MADQFIVTTFKNTSAAYNAASAIKALKQQGGGDVVISSLDEDFVESVTKEMHPEMTAIIVEADEKNSRPVDNIVAIGGGNVYRQVA
jgi:hypothetical protein